MQWQQRGAQVAGFLAKQLQPSFYSAGQPFGYNKLQQLKLLV